MPKYIQEYEGEVNRLPIPVYFINDKKLITAIAIWDTGASNSVISKELANSLNIIPKRKVNASGVFGENQEVNEYIISFFFSEKMGIDNLTVTDSDIGNNLFSGNRLDMLIGMDIISMGNFSVTRCNNKTILEFEIPDNIHLDTSQSDNNSEIE